MNTNMNGYIDGFQRSLCSCALDESSLSIGMVKDLGDQMLPRYPTSSGSTSNSFGISGLENLALKPI